MGGMAHVTRFYILAIVSLVCRAQLADVLFPGIVQSARNIVDSIAGQSLFSYATKTTGDLFAGAVYDITQFPIVLARAIGVQGIVPNIINDNNIVGLTDSILAEYQAGLNNHDANLSIGDLILKYGYPMEKHETLTEDGYALSMYRIPSNGPVVFLMHGLLGSADDYVIAGPESGLAYLLSQEGYDVWMGNARGNKHSRRHFKMLPSEALFWDFSWHEIGYFDLPAMIDYVLNVTNATTLKYIGHSQGTTSFFVMGSARPEYNEKIALAVALSPVAFMSQAKSPFIRLLTLGSGIIHTVLKTIGVYEFLPDNTITRIVKRLMCGTNPVAEVLCSNVLMLTCGFGFSELNVTNLPVIYGHTPSGASVKQVAHYGQSILSGEFKWYDYGPKENFDRYGSEKPPDYPLEKLTAPVSLFYSDADWMSHPGDVDELYQKLSNAIDIHKIPREDFNHLDFLWAKHFRTLVYERLRKLLLAF